MGLGAAMTFPATLSLISNVFSGRGERARATGLWGAIAGVAIAMGPIVGAWLLEHLSWAASSSLWRRSRQPPRSWWRWSLFCGGKKETPGGYVHLSRSESPSLKCMLAAP